MCLLVLPFYFCLCPPASSFCCNNSHAIVLVLSVTCEHILMSPQFYSALAATCQPTRISSSLLHPPAPNCTHLLSWLQFSSPHSHHSFLTSLVIFSFSLPIEKFILSFFSPIIWQSQFSLLLFFSIFAQTKRLLIFHYLIFQHMRFILSMCAHK